MVWLERPGIVALPRYEQVHGVLADWRRFSSAQGVGIDDRYNLGESVITSDPPTHSMYRKPLAEQLSAAALAGDAPAIEATAVRFAEAAVTTGSIDAFADLARPYSLQVVADLVGIPEGERQAYPELAERAFNVFGPAGDRGDDGMAAAADLLARSFNVLEPGWLIPGGRGEDLIRRGLPLGITSYTWPGIDTTVNALASAILLFARHPDQWDAVRADRSLIPGAFNEVLRLHAPVHYFTRSVTEDVELAGVPLPAGTRVLLMYGSANRDERRFPDPDRFDVRRDSAGHLSFGRGVHLCVGLHLARLEASALLGALADRVVRFELAGEPRWLLNQTLHGPARVPVRLITEAT